MNIDLRPLDQRKPASVEAVYDLDNHGPEQTLELLFAAGSQSVESFQVWFGDKEVAGSAVQGNVQLPASWQPPRQTPDIYVSDPVGRSVFRHLGIIIDGTLSSAPRIMSKVSDRGLITGDFTRQEVQDIVDLLNAGIIVAPIEKGKWHSASTQCSVVLVLVSAIARARGTCQMRLKNAMAVMLLLLGTNLLCHAISRGVTATSIRRAIRERSDAILRDRSLSDQEKEDRLKFAINTARGEYRWWDNELLHFAVGAAFLAIGVFLPFVKRVF